jgi:hypothetical protein
MRIFHDVPQNSEAWQALRLGKATASNFGALMANADGAFGEPAKRYALQLALERLTGIKAEHSFSNEHMERGHEQEPVARMMYEEETFSEVTNGGFFDCGEYGDSPDGLVGFDGVVEIKSVIAPTHYATIKRGSFDPAYRWQLVGHLDCTGRQWVDFISYCSDFPADKQLFVSRLRREDAAAEIERLQRRREKFFELVKETMDNIEKETV